MYVRVILNRKKAEIRLSADISRLERATWIAPAMRFMDHSFYVNRMITRIEQKFYDFISDNITRLPDSSAKEICDFILGKKPETTPISAIEYIEQYYEQRILPNPSINVGTKKITEKQPIILSNSQSSMVLGIFY